MRFLNHCALSTRLKLAQVTRVWNDKRAHFYLRTAFHTVQCREFRNLWRSSLAFLCGFWFLHVLISRVGRSADDLGIAYLHASNKHKFFSTQSINKLCSTRWYNIQYVIFHICWYIWHRTLIIHVSPFLFTLYKYDVHSTHLNESNNDVNSV